jgi:TetR/AcrR family transcriptional repressor of lmrAB and yxaGH operons
MPGDAKQQRTDTKERIVRIAAELFRRQGYDGTGLNQILDESGAPRGSLYFHFPGGKQQLAVEAVVSAGTRLGRGMERSLDSADDVAEGIARIIEYIAVDLERSGFERGCPIGAVTLDSALSSEPVRRACREVFDGWLALFEQRLRSGGWAPKAASDEAVLIVSSVEGALMLARSRHSAEPLRAVARRLRAGLRNQ